MDFAKKKIFGILKEAVEQPKVEDAIKKHYEVKINYSPSDGENIGKGPRLIQPTTIGVSKKGNIVLRAYQPNGDTKTKVPAWKLFNIENISSWKPTNRIFNEPPLFNKNGDKTMSKVLLNATFDGLSKEQIMQNIHYSEQEKAKLYNRRRTKGNEQSISDMSKAKKFGDDNFSQTVGPIRKGDVTNAIATQANKINYSNARQNGPVFKNNTEEDESNNTL